MGRLLVERRPSRVVLVGTAGVFPGRAPTVGSVIVARRLGLGATAVTLGLGYQPGAPPVLTADAPDLPGDLPGDLPAGLPACRRADVLTNLAITTSPDLAARFAVDWEIEHMETFGVAWACHAAGVPFAAVLGITNTVGPDAHAEWLRHRSAAESAARAAARALVAAPANC